MMGPNMGKIVLFVIKLMSLGRAHERKSTYIVVFATIKNTPYCPVRLGVIVGRLLGALFISWIWNTTATSICKS